MAVSFVPRIYLLPFSISFWAQDRRRFGRPELHFISVD